MTPQEKARALDALHEKLIEIIGTLQRLCDVHGDIAPLLAELPLSQRRILESYEALTLAYIGFVGDVNALRAPPPPQLPPADFVRGPEPKPPPGLH